MKKIISLLIVSVLLIPCAFADSIDISSLSFSELMTLRHRCQLAMMESEEYQEVTVPQGLWEVGVDIPVGKWIVKCADTARDRLFLGECHISWGTGKPNSEGIFEYDNRKGRASVYNPNNDNYDEGEVTEIIIEVEIGDFIYIDSSYNKAVFCTYTGKPDLGFK